MRAEGGRQAVRQSRKTPLYIESRASRRCHYGLGRPKGPPNARDNN